MNDKLGFATHFQQHWTLDTFPHIVDSGAGWIRDTIAWPEVEAAKGVYAILPRDDAWMKAAGTAGLKVIVCFLYRNALYADPYDPTAYTNAVAWFAKQCAANYPAVQQIEILNEPNNDFQAAEGSGWVQKYITLCNQAYASIKSAVPGMMVAGGGAQLTDNLAMISGGLKVDAFTDHPYAPPLINPDLVYESGTINYLDYRAKIAAATSLPVEETEWGCSTSGDGSSWNIDEVQAGSFILQRILMSQASGVARTFVYAFKDEGFGRDTYSQAGVWTVNNCPKQGFFIYKRVSALLNGNPFIAQITGSDPSVRQYQFANNITAIWRPSGYPNYDTTSKAATLAIPYSGTVTPQVQIFDPFYGNTFLWTGSVTLAGGTVTLSQFPVNGNPMFILLSLPPAPSGTGGIATPTLIALLKEFISLAK